MKAETKKVNRKLNIAKGQLEGISKMVSEDAYCLAISNQILATIALLKNVNRDILSAHLKHCVVNSSQEQALTKVDEISEILKRLA